MAQILYLGPLAIQRISVLAMHSAGTGTDSTYASSIQKQFPLDLSWYYDM